MKEQIRSVIFGISAGLLLLSLLLTPFVWCYCDACRLSAISQKKLINAAGGGQQTLQGNHLLIQAKPGHTPPENISVSLGGQRWHPMEEGAVVLAYDPQLHQQVCVASQNRKAYTPLDIRAMAEQRLEANIDLAPKFDQLVFIESPAAHARTGFKVQNAQTFRLIQETPGAKAELEKDRLFLSFDGELLTENFFCFRLLLQNDYGNALTMVAVLPQPEKEYTPVYTAEDLQAVARNPGGCYRLMNDIDLDGLAWQPIGSAKTPFTGIFDGGGHAVKGLSFSQPSQEQTQEGFSLFGYCRHAVIRNLSILKPQIDGRLVHADRFSAAALATEVTQCLVENCAVYGGHIITDSDSAAGLIVAARDSVLTHLFNSADIEVLMPGWVMQNAGGLVAGMSGHMSYCANEGAVAATHLTGGLFGFGPQTSVWRCVNSGRITGAVFIGEYPPGAFCQTMDSYYLSDCAFVRGSAGRAGSVFEQGAFINIQVIEPGDLQNKEALAVLGSFDGENAQWLLGDSNAKGPVPSGIHSLKGYRPGGDK